MGKKKKYTPPTKYNRVSLAAKIEKLEIRINQFSNILSTVTKSYDEHVEHLANFASHDMKNSLQNMDAILYANNYNNLSKDNWESLQTSLNNIRNSFENFSKLVPYSCTDTFDIKKLIIALNIFIKQDLLDNNIEFKINNSQKIEVEWPFQNILQVLHNIIINAIKSFQKYTVDSPLLVLDCSIEENNCKIIISNNGEKIPNDLKDKIFEYGFTTTNGSGIGLYHAKYMCESLNGSISLNLEEKNNTNNSFILILPLKPSNHD